MNQTTKLPVTPIEWSRMNLSQFLKATSIPYSTTIKWESPPKIVPEKQLTEKQLFTKLKKELKEVSVKLN